MAFSPDGHRLASAGREVTIWDAPAAREVCTLSGIAVADVESLAFSPDGRIVAVGGFRDRSPFVDLCELESGKITRSWNESGIISALVFRPDGAQLAGAGYQEAAVHVWDVVTGNKLNTYHGIAAASSVAYSPDGRRLAGMGYSGEVHLWDSRSGQEMLILRPFAPPPGSLGFTPRLAFSPDGSRIAANSAAGIVTIWDAGAAAVPAFRELEPALTIDSPDRDLASDSRGPALAPESLDATVVQRRAELALRSGRWDEALDDGSRLLKRELDDRSALLIRAHANLAVDDLEAAWSDVSRGLKRAPEDRQFLALAAATHDRQARRLMEQDQPGEARKSLALARSSYDTLLRLEPDRTEAAARLADVLLRSQDLESRPQWITLRPVEMTSAGGATLTELPDGSVLAGGSNPDRDVYTLTVRARLKDVTGFRLEILPHPSLPGGGCGRNSVDGSFALSTFRVKLGPAGAPGSHRPLNLKRAYCDDRQPDELGIESVLDQNDETSWTTGPSARTRGPHWAVFVLDRPLSEDGESALTITLEFRDARQTTQLGLGRLRLSATTTPGRLLDLEQSVYPKLPGWTRLGAAYALRGEWTLALDALAKGAAEPSGGTDCNRFLLSWVNHRLGHTETARRELERAIAGMKQHGFGDELNSLASFVMPELPGTGQKGAVAKLPADEQQAWQSLAAKLDSLLKREATPNGLETIHRRAHALEVSKPGEAEPLFRQALEGYRKTQGPDGELTLDLTRDLANLLDRTGRGALAEPFYRDALEKARKRFGPADPRTVLAFEVPFGMSLVQRGKWSAAEPLLRDAVAQARKLFGPGDPRAAGIMAPFGLCLIERGQLSEAEPVLRETLGIREQTEPDDWRTFNTRSLLGGSLQGQRKYAEAEPLIISGYEGMRAREATIPPQGQPRLTDAAERVVKLYEAWEKKDKAAEWRAKLARPSEETAQHP